MPGCSALNCNNRSGPGRSFHRFPKTSKLKEIWISNSKILKCSNESRLCSSHFTEDQWLQRDGVLRNRLKYGAVPTLFNSDLEIDTTEIIVNQAEASFGSINENDHESKFALHKYKAIIYRLKRQISVLNKNNKILSKKLDVERKKNRVISSLFSEDQIKAVQRRSAKFVPWSNQTVATALTLKFSCGTNGYNNLLKLNLPYPSIRTLNRKLEKLEFDSGILLDVFKFLEIKAKCMNDFQKECILTMDEMDIKVGLDFCVSSDKFVGHITLPEHTGVANRALVIMLGGITSRWKQVVAYYFTGNSTNGSILCGILNEIIVYASKIGLRINAVTTDMGSCNQAMWRKFGIVVGKYSKTVNSMPHPADSNSERLYFLADAPHVYKNIKQTLVTNEVIEIPQDLQQKFNLPTNIVKIEHIKNLVDFQNDMELKFVPKLKHELLEPNHFNKMKVSNSFNVINHNVSSALQFIANEENNDAYLTTAWFLEIVFKWFKLVTSRSPILAISKFNIQKYHETIEFLKMIIELFRNIKIGPQKNGQAVWKPVQTGVILTTTSILNLQDLFLNQKGYSFLLTGRFTQDCLENAFSQLRQRQPVPTCFQFKQNLKMLCVAQYLRTPILESSYDEDDREQIHGFLDIITNSKMNSLKVENKHGITLDKNWNSDSADLSTSEKNILYSCAGYIFKRIKKQRICKTCVSSVGSKVMINKSFTKFVRLKEYREQSLNYVNEKTFKLFVIMEQIFNNFKKSFKIASNKNMRNVSQFLKNEIKNQEQVRTITYPNCHNIREKLINCFVTYRLRIFSGKIKQEINKKFKEQRRYGSKSITMRNLAERIK